MSLHLLGLCVCGIYQTYLYSLLKVLTGYRDKLISHGLPQFGRYSSTTCVCRYDHSRFFLAKCRLGEVIWQPILNPLEIP